MNKKLYEKAVERIETLKKQYAIEQIEIDTAIDNQNDTLHRLYELYFLLKLDRNDLHKELGLIKAYKELGI